MIANARTGHCKMTTALPWFQPPKSRHGTTLCKYFCVKVCYKCKPTTRTGFYRLRRQQVNITEWLRGIIAMRYFSVSPANSRVCRLNNPRNSRIASLTFDERSRLVCCTRVVGRSVGEQIAIDLRARRQVATVTSE